MAFGGEAEALFSEFYAEAPEPQRSIYTTAMGIVDEAWVAADGGVLDLAVDGGAFGGALRAFTTPGPRWCMGCTLGSSRAMREWRGSGSRRS